MLLPLLIAQVRPLDLMLLSGNAQIARFDPQSLPIWVSIGLLQETQVHVEYLSDVVILRIRLFFELGEELLSMRPDLGRRPSSNVLFNSVPVFPEQSQRFQNFNMQDRENINLLTSILSMLPTFKEKCAKFDA